MKKILIVGMMAMMVFPLFAQDEKSEKKNYDLKFRIEGLSDTVIYLANYYGKKQYYKDTADVDKNGYFKFSGMKNYPSGIYLMVLPDRKSYFELIINETSFTMETVKGQLVDKMKIKGSKENEVFYGYMSYIADKQKEAQPLKQKLSSTDDESEISKIQAQLEKIDQDVKSFQKSYIEENQGTFAAKVFSTSPDPIIPDDLEIAEGEDPDKVKFKYFRDHYLDNIDFSDERLIRTPIYHNKVDYYMRKLVAQVPDSINKYADILIGKAKASDELFKYTVHYVTNSYEKSKMMGMDAVFVHMAENYYMKGEAFWVDSANLAKITDRAKTLAPLLLGKVAPNIILPDTNGNWRNLHALNAKYKILYFWDSGCGHCKKATPKLVELYHKLKEEYGVQVFAVGTELENDEWIKFINNKNLDWINVSDTPEINKNAYDYLAKGLTTLESLNFRDTYDIYSTPVVFVLDNENKILGKRLSVEQLEDFIKDIEKAKQKG